MVGSRARGECTDLRGRTLAYTTSELIERREGGRLVDRERTKLIVKRFDRRGRGSSCVVARALSGHNYGGGGPGTRLSGPQLDGRYVYRLATFSPGDYTERAAVLRRPVPTRRCLPQGQSERMPLHSGASGSHAIALAVANGRVYYALPTGFGPTASIYEASPTEFTRR